jgi:hypothetical protein
MKTAVEWLVYQLGLDCTTDHLDEIEQALEMFEKQIIDARQSGIDAALKGRSISNVDYFNETFKQQEQ